MKLKPVQDLATIILRQTKVKLLETKNVTKQFDGTIIIEDINIYLEKGEIVSLLGVSGVGKTTLFNIIAGVLSPDAGNVILNGEDISNKTGKVSYMLQKDMLLAHLSVLDNVALPLFVHGIKKKEARKKAEKLLPVFGLDGMQKKYPSQLSGGMRQRAAFLRTYLFSDEVALLDEPFSALDAITKQEMHKWYIDVMKQIKLSTIFITHDIDEAIMLSDRIYIMGEKPGRIVKEIKIEQNKYTRENFNLTMEFLNYKKEILSYLKMNTKNSQ